MQLKQVLKITKVFFKKGILRIFAGTTIASILAIMFLTMLFPFSQFTFFNYFLPTATNVLLFTSAIILSFSLILGLVTSFVVYQYKKILENRLAMFFSAIGMFFLLSYVLMLSSNSLSLFAYTEMNGFLYTMASFLLLAPIISLSGLLAVNALHVLKNLQSGASSTTGLLAGVVSMGCPTCGSFALSLLGVTGGLSIFPFQGLEVKLLSLGLIGFAVSQININQICKIQRATKHNTVRMFSSKVETLMLVAILFTGGIVAFNHMQISELNSSVSSMSGMLTAGPKKITGDVSLEGVSVTEVSSTAMAVATVFPELKTATSEDEILAIMLPTGTPEYSEALGGISFDDPINSLDYLAKWYYPLTKEVEENDPETWQRYLGLAAEPRGISCEFCCGIGAQGITKEGKSRCGCQHNPAVLSLTMGLIQSTDYNDAEVLREVMRWKTLFFPQSMITLGVEVAGQDPSQIKSLPGMVGGC